MLYILSCLPLLWLPSSFMEATIRLSAAILPPKARVKDPSRCMWLRISAACRTRNLRLDSRLVLALSPLMRRCFALTFCTVRGSRHLRLRDSFCSFWFSTRIFRAACSQHAFFIQSSFSCACSSSQNFRSEILTRVSPSVEELSVVQCLNFSAGCGWGCWFSFGTRSTALENFVYCLSRLQKVLSYSSFRDALSQLRWMFSISDSASVSALRCCTLWMLEAILARSTRSKSFSLVSCVISCFFLNLRSKLGWKRERSIERMESVISCVAKLSHAFTSLSMLKLILVVSNFPCLQSHRALRSWVHGSVFWFSDGMVGGNSMYSLRWQQLQYFEMNIPPTMRRLFGSLSV